MPNKPAIVKKPKIFTNKTDYENAINKQDEIVESAKSKIERLQEQLKALENQTTPQKASTSKKPRAISKVKTTKPTPKKAESNKMVAKKKAEVKKHETIDSKLLEMYDYRKKLAIWRKSFGINNDSKQSCQKCHKGHVRKTILLDDGRHVCWFCWIRKPANLQKKSQEVKNQQQSNRFDNELKKHIQKINHEKKISFEELYWEEVQTLKTAFEVMNRQEQNEMIKSIPKMIEHLIDKKIIKNKVK